MVRGRNNTCHTSGVLRGKGDAPLTANLQIFPRSNLPSFSSLDHKLIGIFFGVCPYLAILSPCLTAFGDTLTHVSQVQDPHLMCSA